MQSPQRAVIVKLETNRGHIMTTPATATEETKVNTIKTKAKQKDGSYLHYEAPISVPTTADAFGALYAGANAELKVFIAQCAELGVSSKARNHLVSGRITSADTITYAKVLEAQEEAAANRANNGAALALYRELQSMLVQFATATYNLSAKGQATFKRLVSDPTVLTVASDKHRERVASILDAFAAALTEDKLAEYANYLEKLEAACTGETDSEDDF